MKLLSEKLIRQITEKAAGTTSKVGEPDKKMVVRQHGGHTGVGVSVIEGHPISICFTIHEI